MAVRTLLLVYVVFGLFMLFFLLRVSVVHAEDLVNPPLDITNDDNPPTKDPGNGGGGGGGSPPPSHQIRVRVVDYETGVAVPGINVYINLPMPVLVGQTDADGYVIYTTVSGHPYPNTNYRITVNGQDNYNLGVWPEDYHWGQRATTITTDNNAYAHVTIPLQRATLVNVVAAALFSNSQYVSLYYGRETYASFSHTVSFSVAGSGISIGYSSSRTLSRTFGVDPLNKACVKWAHYANTYIDDTWGIVKTGITKNVDNQAPGTYEIQEYIDPYSLTRGYEDLQLVNGTWVYAEYRETGSYTWSASLSIDFAIQYLAYGIHVSLDTIVTSTEGVTNWVAYKVYNTSGRTLKFRAYTCGASLNTGSKIGGMELHVWEIEDC